MAVYKFNNQEYRGGAALEEALNKAREDEEIIEGDTVTIYFNDYSLNTISGATAFGVPFSFSGKWISFIFPYYKTGTIITFKYSKYSKGVIFYSKTLPIGPGPDSSLITFQDYLNNVTITPDTGEPQTFNDYDSMDSALRGMTSGTKVNLTLNTKDGTNIKSVSTSTEIAEPMMCAEDGDDITYTVDGHTLSNKMYGEKMAYPAGVSPENEANSYLQLETVYGPPQAANAGGVLNGNDIKNITVNGTSPVILDMTFEASTPRVTVSSMTAAAGFGENQPGALAVGYVYNAADLTEGALTDAKIEMSGEITDTNNPAGVKAYKDAVPTVSYDVDKENNYCGYWFKPKNGKDIVYEYECDINANLTYTGGEDTARATVFFGGN